MLVDSGPMQTAEAAVEHNHLSGRTSLPPGAP
jgi:hypothetical protein